MKSGIRREGEEVGRVSDGLEGIDYTKLSGLKESLWKRLLRKLGFFKPNADKEWEQIEKNLVELGKKTEEYVRKAKDHAEERSKRAQEIKEGKRFGFGDDLIGR